MAEPLKVERRGGARPNSGPKKDPNRTLATYQVAKMLRKAKKLARLRGKDIDDILLEVIYSAQDKPRDVLAAIKIFKDLTMPKISEGGAADKALAPAVYLPAQRPVLKSIEGGKAA
jgi:hypothetical protein